jgi:hypothetical protein
MMDVYYFSKTYSYFPECPIWGLGVIWNGNLFFVDWGDIDNGKENLVSVFVASGSGFGRARVEFGKSIAWA